MTAPVSPVRLHRQLTAIWGTAPGWGRFAAVNHTIMGRRFIVAAFVFFAIGGILAMLIRAQLATPRSAFVGPEIYNQIFTMHGTVMMFLFAIPMFEGLAMYLLPKLLGARDMAFPRLGAYGFWCYVFGGSIVVGSMLFGVAPHAGWFMYTPLSSQPYSPGINSDIWLIGITFVEISALAAAVEIAVTVLKFRAPGMSLDRMPIMAWYLLVTAMMMLVGFPPLILGSILLEIERAFGWPFFDPTRGGDALLWQHLFWLFGHPEVYIIFLPAAGVVSTLIPVFARHTLLGYSWIVVSLIALAFLSFGLWVHHMFTVGIPHMAVGFFSAASMLVAIPTGVQIFAWLGTLSLGRPRLSLPMLFLAGFFFVFVAGGLTGVMLAVVPFDWQAHDTQFVVAHLHYVLVGGFVFPMLAAAYYWLPHFTGRRSVYRLGVAAFWLIFTGFNLTFFLMHLTGLLGMPRRIHTYPEGVGWDWLNLLSSVGGFLMAIGFALFVVDVGLQLRFGQRARRDPWQAETLEWAMPIPPASYGFASLPEVSGRAPLQQDRDLPRRLAAGEGYLGFTRNGWLETLGVDVASGRIEQIVILPGPTALPLWTALATGGFFVSVLAKLYWLTPVALAAIVVLLLMWTRASGQKDDLGPLPVGRGTSAPTQYEADGAPAWWATLFILVADATLFGSLLFACLFLWVIAPGWPPPALIDTGGAMALAAVAGLVGAAFAGRRAVRDAAASGRREAWSLAGALAGSVALAGTAWVAFAALPDPAGHAYAASHAVVIAYVGLHAAVGIILSLHAWRRSRAGYLSGRRTLDLRVGALWHDYSAASGAAGFGLAYALPWLLA